MNNIKDLIDKYFLGETSLEEEKKLREYFQQTEIDPEMKVFQPLFGLLESERSKQLGEQFDERVYSKIQSSQKRIPVLKMAHRWVGAVAASLILVLSVWWLYPNVDQDQTSAINWEQFEPEDPAEAYRITKEALLKVSIGLNKGAAKAAQEVSIVKSFLKD